MPENPNTRRKFLLGVGTGLTTALAGCSSLDIDGISEGQSEQDGTSSSSSAGLKTQPEDSQYVQGGKMTVGPRLNVYNIENISKDSITINLRALPNPLADYDIEVYFTPISEVPTEWDYGATRVTAEEEYDESQHRWIIAEQERYTNDGESNDIGDFCYTLLAKEHGEKIGSFTIPSGAAGMVSQDVNPPKGLTADELNKVVQESDVAPPMIKREYLQQEYTDWYTDLPSVGDRYRDPLYDRVKNTKAIGNSVPPGSHIASQNEAVGSYTTDIYPKLTRRMGYPYQKNIDLDREIPDMVPGVFTFTWTEQPTVSTRAGDVIDQTEQFVRVGDEVHAPPRLGFKIGGTGPRLESRTISDIDTQHFERYFAQGHPSPEKPHFHTKVDDTSGNNAVKHWRTSDYGRNSPENQEIAKMNMKQDSDKERALRFSGQTPPHLMNGGVQNMWGIEYTIPDDVAREAQVAGRRIRNEASGSVESFKQMYENEEILQHPKLQEVAQKLRRVCDNIGAESKPAQLRVVADFVQYLPHSYASYSKDINNGGRLGDMSDIPKDYITDPGNGGSHPVWTLYGCWGDCEDFTALYNAIVSTDHFDVETVDTAMLTGIKRYNGAGAATAHTTPAVPLDELGVGEIIHNESNADVDFSRYYIPATYEHNGTEYAYIETSSMAPLGMVTGKDAQFVDALPPRSLDSFA